MATSAWEVSGAEPDGFLAHDNLYHGNQFFFGAVSSSEQMTRLPGAHIARNGLDYYSSQFYVSGKRQTETGRKEAITGTGGLLVVEIIEPLKTWSRTRRSLNLGIPRHVLAPLQRWVRRKRS